jgi:hypothetical protein
MDHATRATATLAGRKCFPAQRQLGQMLNMSVNKPEIGEEQQKYNLSNISSMLGMNENV